MEGSMFGQEKSLTLTFYEYRRVAHDFGGAVSGCPNGISTIVTLRCPPADHVRLSTTEKKDILSVEVPPLCVDGTCDGCNYHFLVFSPYACPICRPQDVARLEGSCNGGEREVNVFAAK
ncbi:unnamed protein product [Dibothriocephalus latus]|uniref:MRH domain-containing protein n=1 Tax=Dibothriocephalus latus TaxID=60516 RepID=A0A3P7MG99_DIBLA|nr:unnamed protein product [Dibothriocephalus latus]